MGGVSSILHSLFDRYHHCCCCFFAIIVTLVDYEELIIILSTTGDPTRIEGLLTNLHLFFMAAAAAVLFFLFLLLLLLLSLDNVEKEFFPIGSLTLVDLRDRSLSFQNFVLAGKNCLASFGRSFERHDIAPLERISRKVKYLYFPLDRISGTRIKTLVLGSSTILDLL